MEKKQVEKPVESIRDISEKWNDDLYESLRNLERLEKVARLGDDNLFGWIARNCLYPGNVALMIGNSRIEAVEYFLEEAKILISNYKSLLTEEEHKLISLELDKGFNLLRGGSGEIATRTSDEHGKNPGLDLEKPFLNCCDLITKLRDTLVNLDGIKKYLFVEREDVKGKER